MSTDTSQDRLAETTSETEPEKNNTPRKKKKKKSKKWIVVLLVVVVLILAVLRFRRNRRPQAAADMASYTEFAVTRMNIMESLSGTGALQPVDSYTVTTLVEGEILNAEFEEGDVVEKDSVLYTVDNSDKSSSIERAELTLEQARNNYNRKQESAEKLNVKANGAGAITALNIEIGDSVMSGQQIASILDSATMKLTLPFLTDVATGFYIGQEAKVMLDGGFETLSGTVVKINGTDDVLTGNIIVRQVTLEVPNPGALTEKHTASAMIGDSYCVSSGTFKYNGSYNVTAEISGTVSRLSASEGDIVSKGSVIAVLVSDTLGDEIQNAYNSVRDAELALQNQYDQLEMYKITSPITGTIVEKNYKTGDTLSAGKMLCTIYDMSALTFTMNVDELDISQIETGQSVSITSDAVSGKLFNGIVTKISVQGSTSNGVTTYPVTVRIDETEGLLPGMNVNATIIMRSVSNVLAVPVEAVSRGNYVLVKTDGSQASNDVIPERDFNGGNMPEGTREGEPVQNWNNGMLSEARTGSLNNANVPEGYTYVQVTTGVSNESFIEITSGLKEGDIIAYIAPTDNSGFTFGMNMNFGGAGQMPAGATRIEAQPGGAVTRGGD